MVRKNIILILVCIGIFSIAPSIASNLPKKDNKKAKQEKMEDFIDNLLQKMTLEEKIGQMNQVGGTFANTGPINPLSPQGKEMREGKIGSVLNLAGVDGIRKIQKVAVEETRLHIPLIFGLDVIHGMKTIFPIPLAEAASWDLVAIEQSARVAAIESSAMGVNWTFAPMVDIARDPRWGRIAEGAGEDAYLGMQIAKARVKGFQGDDLSDNNTIAACAKHYAAYGAAIAGRDYNAVDMSEVTLFDVYLPPFKAAVDAGAATFMSSFNTLNGVPATANEFLLRDILKEKWGFNGFVVSDANSVQELIPHGLVENKTEAARMAANAGLDMDMGSGVFLQELPKLVRKGIVSENVIDEAVRRILKIKYELGLFDDPYRYCDEKREKTDVLSVDHQEASRDMARKSMVLLKNENNLLPLKKDIRKIAVIGAMTNSKGDMIGCWGAGGEAKDVVDILQGIRLAVSPATQVIYSRGCEIDASEPEDFSEALFVAGKADVVVMTMGEAGGMSGEAHSRVDINIPGNQEKLLSEIVKLGKPVVVLLTNGRPLTIGKVSEQASAILETWFLGTQAGNAIADVLFGDYNPSGKLPVSFPRDLGQVPLSYSELNTGRPLAEQSESIFRSRYIDGANDALYPFGFGLSYTTFEYSNLHLSQDYLTSDDEIQVSVDVKNTGSCTGAEVVQLYIRDYYASVCQPTKLLKGFKKISIKPGQTQSVSFTLNANNLKYHNWKLEEVVEPGRFAIFIGGDSQKTLKTEFVLK